MKIIINSSSMVPIYEQIMDQIKARITDGDLKENDILPSVRTLAKDLKISALTVKKAYDNLEQDGFTVTVHGKGTYVAAANTERMLEEQRREVEEGIEKAVEKDTSRVYSAPYRNAGIYRCGICAGAGRDDWDCHVYKIRYLCGQHSPCIQ